MYKELTPIFLILYQKTHEEGTLTNSFYEATITDTKTTKRHYQEKKNYRPVSLMNVGTKILSKILTNQTQQCIKRIIHHYQALFIPSHKDGSVYINQLLWHNRPTKGKARTTRASQQVQENMRQNSPPTHDRHSHQRGHRWNMSQHHKTHLQQTHSLHNTQRWKTESLPAKFRNKTRMFTLTTSIQHSINSPHHSNPTRKIN